MKNNRHKIMSVCLIVISSMVLSISFAARDNNERKDNRQDRKDHRDRKENRQDRKDQRVRKDNHQSRRDYNKQLSSNKNYHRDKRYQLNHYYPRRGISVSILPSRYHTIRHRHTNYYYSSGIWYRPFGASFTVVAPPFGVVVPVLPSVYSTIWFHSTPYYYANDVYYVWRPNLNGYEVVEPPEKIVQETPPIVTEEIIVYPKQGQSEQKQADDRYACHSWGKKQTNYDPTQPPEDLSVSKLNQKRSDYQRAIRACLEGRGYSVR